MGIDGNPADPLDHEAQPWRCVPDGRNERPCDIEVTADGKVFFRDRSGAPAGVIGPDLSLRRGVSEPAVFALEPTGDLLGLGLLQRPDAAQVLFCRLTAEPALRCHHEFRTSLRGRIWNEENCSKSFVARVERGAITIAFPAFPDAPPYLAARIVPLPADDASKALALFLFAMEAVDRDTDRHTPYVDDMQVPR
ncbi:MAG: hypothetical protein IT380_19775 [Myxococcales bacterium]|nr:hypothetical protein [Myxococcales bacterium]